MTRITDERIASMIADQEQLADWTDDPDDRADATELAAALRELLRRRNPPELDWQAGFVDIRQCPPES